MNSIAKVVCKLKSKNEYNAVVPYKRVKLPLKVDSDEFEYELQIQPMMVMAQL